MISLYSEDRQNDLPLDLTDLPAIVEAVLQLEGEKADEVSVCFVSEKEISHLHDVHFGDPSVTDCISFPIDGKETDYRVLGEVVVCPKVAERYVEEHGGDLHQEVTLYLIHGLLHLMGYDDLEEEKEKEMRQAEQRHLENLKKLGLQLK